MALTGRAVLAALLGVVVVALAPAHGWTVVAVVTVLLAASAVDVALAPSPRALRLERSGDTSTRLGEPATVTLTVAGERRLRGRVRDAWPPTAAATPRSFRVDVPAGGRGRLSSVLVPTRRGERATAGVTIRSLGPLGLAGRQRTRPAPWTVRVLPAFTSRRLLPEKLARLRELDGSVAALVRGQGSEFDSLRAYVDGDDPRSIDWRATARRSEVVVRTWRPERDRQVLLVLDSGRTAAGRVGGAPRFESSLDAALLLAALARHAGDRVGLLVHDRVLRGAVDVSTGDVLPAIVEATAGVEPALVETDTRAVSSQVLRRLRRRSLVVWFTAVEPAAADEGLRTAVGALAHRHAVVLAAVADPRLVELRAGRHDADAVYAAAAAEAAATDQDRVVAGFRRRGVVVVTAPPDDFASQVADAYLDLKAAGRL